MNTTTEIFRDAQALAEFSNLDEARAEYFQHNFPGFVPKSWWSTVHADQKGASRLWLRYRDALQNAWKERFPLDKTIALISGVHIGIFPIPDEAAENVSSYEFNPDVVHVWPYQRAIMFLAIEPWRARFCVCGKRFVADVSTRLFCSTRCSSEARKASRKDWWDSRGSKWRNEWRRRKRRDKRQKKTNK